MGWWVTPLGPTPHPPNPPPPPPPCTSGHKILYQTVQFACLAWAIGVPGHSSQPRPPPRSQGKNCPSNADIFVTQRRAQGSVERARQPSTRTYYKGGGGLQAGNQQTLLAAHVLVHIPEKPPTTLQNTGARASWGPSSHSHHLDLKCQGAVAGDAAGQGVWMVGGGGGQVPTHASGGCWG